MTTEEAEVCSRCHRPITRPDQTCVFLGQRWPCVPPSDQSVMEVDGLRIKTGRAHVRPVRQLDDPYA